MITLQCSILCNCSDWIAHSSVNFENYKSCKQSYDAFGDDPLPFNFAVLTVVNNIKFEEHNFAFFPAILSCQASPKDRTLIIAAHPITFLPARKQLFKSKKKNTIIFLVEKNVVDWNDIIDRTVILSSFEVQSLASGWAAIRCA